MKSLSTDRQRVYQDSDKSVGTEMVVTSGDINVDNFAHFSESLARFVPPRNRQRKRRTVFSPAATHVLQQEFNNDCYPDNARLLRLAQVIGHSDIAAIQTWFQNHRSRAKQSLRRTVNTNVIDTSSGGGGDVRQTTLSENVVVKSVVRRRKRATNNVENGSGDIPTTTPMTPTKRRRVSPPGELDQTSADLTRPLASRRRNFGEPQMPVLEAAAAAEDGDGMNATKKIRYFSNFYRQPEPGEVFVGGRLKSETGDDVHSDQSINHVSWMKDSPPNLLPLSSPFPLNFMTQTHLMPALSLPHPSLAAVWGGHRPVHGTLTSFPPSLGHVTAYDVAESPLCRRPYSAHLNQLR